DRGEQARAARAARPLGRAPAAATGRTTGLGGHPLGDRPVERAAAAAVAGHRAAARHALLPWPVDGRLPAHPVRATAGPAAPHRAGPGPVLGVLAGLRPPPRSEEHTSELQSRENLVC